ncbi:MAG: SDR family NAD(P)-dependent oxidoreductase [Anaerolineae bacterium]|nr:MAG: SDR family NAD(P)-dependent oxidoreductase [Anaerolineae bacterium]
MNRIQSWIEKHIPEQGGKTILITGANSGIGFEAARILAERGASVIMACRSPEKGQQAAARISAAVEVMHLDLADLRQIEAFVAAFGERHERLDVLINNAGVMACPLQRTADGFEMQFGVNHLGHFALTGHLLPHLLAAPAGRVVTVSSMVHHRGRMDFDNLNAEKSYHRWGAYAQSKLANLLFTFELQRRLAAAGHQAISVAAHPGYSATRLQRHLGVFQIGNLLAQSARMGALPTVYAAAATDVQGGEFFGPRWFEYRGFPVRVQANPAAHNRAHARRLWEISERLTEITFPL